MSEPSRWSRNLSEEVVPSLYIVQTSDWCWGKGSTLAIAIKQCRGNGSKVTRTGRKVDYVVYAFDDMVNPDACWIDNMGTCRWELMPGTELDTNNFKQGLINEWLWQDGQNKSMMPE